MTVQKANNFLILMSTNYQNLLDELQAREKLIKQCMSDLRERNKNLRYMHEQQLKSKYFQQQANRKLFLFGD
jgi:hypothetical protein